MPLPDSRTQTGLSTSSVSRSGRSVRPLTVPAAELVALDSITPHSLSVSEFPTIKRPGGARKSTLREMMFGKDMKEKDEHDDMDGLDSWRRDEDEDKTEHKGTVGVAL